MSPHIIRPSRTHMLSPLQRSRWATKYVANPITGCWAWSGARFPGGYGQVRIADGSGGELFLAHRIAFELEHGPIPDGLLVRHRCDNKLCVNPAHLELGTNADNMRDAVLRGSVARGTRCGTSKLTEADVLEIVERYANGETQRALGGAYGVDKTTVHAIVNGFSWSHVTGLDPRTRTVA